MNQLASYYQRNPVKTVLGFVLLGALLQGWLA